MLIQEGDVEIHALAARGGRCRRSAGIPAATASPSVATWLATVPARALTLVALGRFQAQAPRPAHPDSRKPGVRDQPSAAVVSTADQRGPIFCAAPHDWLP